MNNWQLCSVIFGRHRGRRLQMRVRALWTSWSCPVALSFRFVLLLVRLRLVYFAYSTQRDGTQQKRLSACCLNLVHFTRKAKIGGGVKGEGA